jgi:phage shock protein C
MGNKLYRSQDDKMIGGVCGGLAEHFKIDPSLVRLAFALLFFLGGHGLLVYLILWIIIPPVPNPGIVDVISHDQPPTRPE